METLWDNLSGDEGNLGFASGWANPFESNVAVCPWIAVELELWNWSCGILLGKVDSLWQLKGPRGGREEETGQAES
jgi:hypothetical protein